jgi:WD40 repeat protein
MTASPCYAFYMQFSRLMIVVFVALHLVGSVGAGEVTLEHVATFGDAEFRHADRITQIVALADGKHLLSASEDHTVRLWEGKSGEQIRLFPHREKVEAVVPLPDGKRMLTGTLVRRIWRLRKVG